MIHHAVRMEIHPRPVRRFNDGGRVQRAAGNARPSTGLKPPSETGILKVATKRLDTYYLDRHENPVGPEYALVSDYAQARGWEVEWTMLDSTADVLAALEAGTTHLAASGLTHLHTRNELFTPGPAHTEITEQLVCHRDDRPLPRKPEDIQGIDIAVTAGSSYVDTLNELAGQHPEIEFREDSERTTEVILAEVADRNVGCTVADSNIVQVMRHFRTWRVAHEPDRRAQSGLVPAGRLDELAADPGWMNSKEGDEALGRMENLYYAYIGDFDFVDLRA